MNPWICISLTCIVITRVKHIYVSVWFIALREVHNYNILYMWSPQLLCRRSRRIHHWHAENDFIPFDSLAIPYPVSIRTIFKVCFNHSYSFIFLWILSQVILYQTLSNLFSLVECSTYVYFACKYHLKVFGHKI